MCVFGSDCFVFEDSGKTCTVNPFTEAIGAANNVLICDIAVAYDCPLTHKTYILITRNSLYVPAMEHNLVPPFIMRMAGITVNECPKYQCSDPSSDDHSLIFNHEDLKINLQLNGIFSYFHTRRPTDNEIQGCEKVFLTPDSSFWNPYCTSFKANEREMTDYQGELTIKQRWENNPMFDVDGTASLVSELQLRCHIDEVTSHSF